MKEKGVTQIKLEKTVKSHKFINARKKFARSNSPKLKKVEPDLLPNPFWHDNEVMERFHMEKRFGSAKKVLVDNFTLDEG